MVHTEDPEAQLSPPTAEWAREDYTRWQEALQRLQAVREVYNTHLARVEEVHAVVPLARAIPVLQEIQRTLNALFDPTTVFRDVAVPRFSLRRLVYRWLDRWMQPLLERQKAFQGAVVHLLNELVTYLVRLTEQLHVWSSRQVQFYQQITPWLDAKIEVVQRQQNHNVTYNMGLVMEYLKTVEQHLIAHVQQQIEELWHQVTRTTQPHIQTDAHRWRAVQLELEAIRDRLQGTSPSTAWAPDAAYGRPLPEWMFPEVRDFRYIAFEAIFRGTSEWLKEKMRRYIPYFADAPEPIVDIGCGRGEFLELMRDLGKEAYGVEINTYAIAQLREKRLQVVDEDALQHVRRLQPDSIGGVFCAQVVEHLVPEHVYELIKRLFTAMRSGAPLVIETLNPLSVYAFHHVYLLDPTHVYPVHPQTLVFFMRYVGFERVEVHTISPVPEHARLPAPPSDASAEVTVQYLQTLIRRLNEILFSPLEYYVVGYVP